MSLDKRRDVKEVLVGESDRAYFPFSCASVPHTSLALQFILRHSVCAMNEICSMWRLRKRAPRAMGRRSGNVAAIRRTLALRAPNPFPNSLRQQTMRRRHLQESPHSDAVFANWRQRDPSSVARSRTKEPCCGIWIRMPAPSPVSGSQPHSPRCAIVNQKSAVFRHRQIDKGLFMVGTLGRRTGSRREEERRGFALKGLAQGCVIDPRVRKYGKAGWSNHVVFCFSCLQTRSYWRPSMLEVSSVRQYSRSRHLHLTLFKISYIFFFCYYMDLEPAKLLGT